MILNPNIQMHMRNARDDLQKAIDAGRWDADMMVLQHISQAIKTLDAYLGWYA